MIGNYEVDFLHSKIICAPLLTEIIAVPLCEWRQRTISHPVSLRIFFLHTAFDLIHAVRKDRGAVLYRGAWDFCHNYSKNMAYFEDRPYCSRKNCQKLAKLIILSHTNFRLYFDSMLLESLLLGFLKWFTKLSNSVIRLRFETKIIVNVHGKSRVIFQGTKYILTSVRRRGIK